MTNLFSAAVFMTLSFFCASASAGQAGSALSTLDQTIDVNSPPPAPPSPATSQPQGPHPDLQLWNEYISENFGDRPARMERDSSKGAAGPVVETVSLAPILNASYKSGLTFKTSGHTVNISGAEALNCQKGESCSSNDKYFLLFTAEDGQTMFVRAKDIANALFMSGSKDISFSGDSDKYTVRLDIKVTSPGQSRLKIEGHGREVLDISLDDLTAALTKKGHELTVGARHRLYYNTAILQDAAGNGRFAKENVLIFSPRGKDPNQSVRASQIGASGVLLPNVEKDLGFRILGGKLEIYKL